VLRYVADWVIARGAEVSADEREGGKGDVAVGEAAFHDVVQDGDAHARDQQHRPGYGRYPLRHLLSSTPLRTTA